MPRSCRTRSSRSFHPGSSPLRVLLLPPPFSSCVTRQRSAGHVLVWLLILSSSLQFSFCLTPSCTVVVLVLNQLSLVLLLGTFDSWVFLKAPRDSFLQMPIWWLLLFSLNSSRPSSSCSNLVMVPSLHSLLCGIDLPDSGRLRPCHPSVAPYAVMWGWHLAFWS